MNYQQIIERLSLLRISKNLSARELGLKLGNSETYFYKIENGSIILSTPKLLEVLEALEISTEEFFYGNLDNYKNDMEILNLTSKLSKEEFDALKILINKK
ncbi:MAG: helix-turn-helix transcriptional regulator [Clostridia bacterium]|nr:helix-turn-helix transcriptional regulator [Clostridia bacterium]